MTEKITRARAAAAIREIRALLEERLRTSHGKRIATCALSDLDAYLARPLKPKPKPRRFVAREVW